VGKQRDKASQKPDPNISDYVGGNPNEVGVEASRATQTDYHQPWVTDRAWICGVAGVTAIIVSAFVFEAYDVLNEGFWLAGWRLTSNRNEGMLAALLIIAFVMSSVEVVRLSRFYGSEFIQRSPLLLKRDYSGFIIECVKSYLYLMLLFGLARYGYHTLQEYGFRSNQQYYQPWFVVLEFLWLVFLWAGLPYILFTRAYRHNPQNDRKDLATLTEKVVKFLCVKLKIPGVRLPNFGIDDKRAALGFAVKFFFVPVMTVFFVDNFGGLVNNMDYLTAGFIGHITNGTYTWELAGKDIGNIGTTLIFCLDVGLAWVGYTLSSRWLDNQTVSAEPTWLGWIVCLISYPPFRVIGGWFVTGPGEKLYQSLPFSPLVNLFGGMMLISFFVYMLPTIWFGVRFSNLTHRGILRKGPFAIVRHPAYAAKNFGWWCVGFPVAIYIMFTSSFSMGMFYILGLIFASSIYYARAITEERHLSLDPDYVEYCKHVKYRFIPGVI
jgi:protein-S-isoprenylcysteine O-methyltransferase Ste14